MGANEPRVEFVISPEQEQRAAAIKRFNLLFVYFPIGLGVVVVLAVVALLVSVAVSGENSTRPIDISATADVIVVMMTLPALLICGLVPAGALGLAITMRRRQYGPVRAIQRLLWRLENGIAKIGKGIQRATAPFARRTIGLHARAAQIDSLLSRAGRIIKRSK